MTYSWAYPDTEFIICPADTGYTGSPDLIISKDNWFRDNLATEKVMSELQKCGKYFTEAISVFAKR